MDRGTAQALVDAGVVAVVNAGPMISGRYPNLGPELLVDAGVVVVDRAGSEVFDRLRDGTEVRVDAGVVHAGDTLVETRNSSATGSFTFSTQVTVGSYLVTYTLPSGWSNTGSRPLAVVR